VCTAPLKSADVQTCLSLPWGASLAGRAHDINYLPPDYEVTLEELCPNQIQPPGARKRGPSGRTKQGLDAARPAATKRAADAAAMPG
jgi:hypothetical protein